MSINGFWKQWQNKEKGRNAKRFYVRSSVTSVPKNLQTSDKKNLQKSIRIGVLGASGYTGSEVLFSRPFDSWIVSLEICCIKCFGCFLSMRFKTCNMAMPFQKLLNICWNFFVVMLGCIGYHNLLLLNSGNFFFCGSWS